jgi:hypothetical protein
MKTILQKCLIVALCLSFISLSAFSQRNRNAAPQSIDDRTYWVDLLYKISDPILSNMSKGELKKNMKVDYSPTYDSRNKDVNYMEAFGRLIAGVAPWLNLPDDDTPEGKKRAQIREWTLKSLVHAVDPESPDYLLWTGPHQVLVDASYIANAFIRAPKALWEPLDQVTKDRYIEHFKGLRKLAPWYNNWILFKAMIEAFLLSIDEDYDAYSLNITVRKIDEWYVGDGWYSDGPNFSLDYYNSYVIHTYLVEILEMMEKKRVWTPIKHELALRRMQRYNQLIERMISPEATYPVLGRSMTYRMAAFQTLSLSAWKYGMPQHLTEGQVRHALTSVMKRMFSAKGTFCKDGFLQLGFVGHQPDLADYYTSTGSLYITSIVFLPLGLPADHSFWTSPPEKWTTQKAWDGEPIPKDYYQTIRQ